MADFSNRWIFAKFFETGKSTTALESTTRWPENFNVENNVRPSGGKLTWPLTDGNDDYEEFIFASL